MDPRPRPGAEETGQRLSRELTAWTLHNCVPHLCPVLLDSCLLSLPGCLLVHSAAPIHPSSSLCLVGPPWCLDILSQTEELRAYGVRNKSREA